MTFFMCESMEGPVCINLDNVAYFRNLYGNPGNEQIEVFMNCQRDGRIVIQGRAEDLAKAINQAANNE